ncbi:Rieske 2Fe-2S domain-containing protein [Halostella sp. JP-L12]|uniref:Rieske (2Fe-2S) protein n=1 Tax=Halostella TaxID=1843185 RepID=UPI000EF7A3B4|nr:MULTISPECIES: Rieske 2Fe-2S domain-containing protein [Halostella]NHN48259.1 Rieske 2Fe-2S domain-containing protein [Halostella sp. JP-L12]
MREGNRVSVEAEGGEETARIHDDEGEVSAGDAMFRFSVSSSGGTDDSASNADPTDEDGESRFVAPVADVPRESTLRCEALDGRRGTEFILQRSGDDVLAWRNSCPHKPKVRLDPGDGAIVSDGQVVCHEHGARFECGDGFCTAGPCRGDSLDAVTIEVRDGDVYLTDDRFDACRRLDR